MVADKKRAVSVRTVIDAACLGVASRLLKDFGGIAND